MTTADDSTTPVLELNGIAVHFGGVAALSGVDLRVVPATVHALIGPNGAGKTTLLNAISRFIQPAAGTITVNGRDATHLPAHDLAGLGVARTFQHPVLVEDMTALENVEFGLYGRYGTHIWDDLLFSWHAVKQKRRRQEGAVRVFETFGLERFMRMPAGDLSFGNRKLVDLARAWSLQPDLLLLDEPTAGLDRANIKRLTDLIVSNKHRMAVLVVEHHMEFVNSVADTVTVLSSGMKIAEGRPETVRQNPAVVEAYTGIAG